MMEASTVTELAGAADRTGFRLMRLEVFNWGTFDRQVWSLTAGGENTLLTGDIGSGKSTLVDALTTLLVPPAKLAYNKAAGAEARERSLKSYVLGHFKAERGDEGGGTRAVALRDRSSYSVILAEFDNALLGENLTLAQVFWSRDEEGQPARMYVVSRESLSIAKHFAGFGSDISQLRRRLRLAGVELHDTFPPYGASFRRSFGIENEQALELFHQTVSMKSVGNLTDFVRRHMLQPAPMEERVRALVGHFDDLNRAHEAVLKARAQIDKLEPLVADCDRHAELTREVGALRSCRDALRPWFANQKRVLLEKRLDKLAGDIERLEARIATLDGTRAQQQRDRDEVVRAIAENGGDRIERLKSESRSTREEMEKRQTARHKYDELARALELPAASTSDLFVANRAGVARALVETEDDQSCVQNKRTEAEVDFRTLRSQHDELVAELESLRQRTSNIPSHMLRLRDEMCRALGVDEGELPFAGELLQVREDEAAWEGAIERVLRGFGLSLLVPDERYGDVAAWADRTHLAGRLVYFRVRPLRSAPEAPASPASLVRKLRIKPDSAFYDWLEGELGRRFDYVCCDTLDAFRLEKHAITRAGQIKGSGQRHEKDDRHRIDDRSRYVLGWSNEAKIEALDRQRRDLETRMQALADRIAGISHQLSALSKRREQLTNLAFYESFGDLDWQPLASRIDELDRERRRLEAASDTLHALQERLTELDDARAKTHEALAGAQRDGAAAQSKHDDAARLHEECRGVLAAAPIAVVEGLPDLDATVEAELQDRQLTVESCDNCERHVRDRLQDRIDTEDKKITRLGEKIAGAMQAYNAAFPVETREADATVAAAGEYRKMLEQLRTDDLPRFEQRFKHLLNENTIREVANFQSQLSKERQNIHERVETINRSLREIDYNPGRYMKLEPDANPDTEIREFQQDLRACTEGALTGSEDDAYSEAKFLQVRRIIERFRGREGTTDVDQRWTSKVTDVRNWYSFSASERFRENDQEHEHYTDSGGKSGGQKEKLAYTVLAASLAYQFGLEWGAPRSRSFRFVVIDEAFGRGSDESTRYGLKLFDQLQLQLLIVTPLQKIHVIEPHVASVGFVHNEDGRRSMIRNLTIEEYRAEQAARTA
jgi:uncharacterized protein YPO0396